LEIPDPKQGWDGCEVEGDRIMLAEVAKELGFIAKTTGGDWKATLREPATETARVTLLLVTAKDEVLLDPPAEWDVGVELTLGSSEIHIRTAAADPYIVDFVDS